MSLHFQALFLVGALALSACGPFSRKGEPKDLFPADSASRSLAQSIQIETPVLNYRLSGGEDAYFGSILFRNDSTVWIGDLGRHAVRRFSWDGTELEPIVGLGYPYLVRANGDSVTVFDAGSNRVVSPADTADVLKLPPVPEDAGALSRQVAIVREALYVKDAVPPNAAILRLEDGSEPSTIRLTGPSWRHFGVLRTWKGRILSVSSYWPVVHTLDEGVTLDSMRLVGFDSPMLARLRAYSEGSVDELPLMISGVQGEGDALYLINVRPGIIRIDVFDSNARLMRILQFEEPEPTGFTPVDLAVQTRGDSTYAFVASVSTDYGPLSLRYASHLDRFSFPTVPAN